MKKTLRILLAAFIAIGFTACGAPAAPTLPTAPPAPAATMTSPTAAAAAPAVVTFADPALEEMIRGAMGKPQGDITVAEAQAVTRLNLSIDLQRHVSAQTPIKDISGLENFANLESLDLSFHAITDISALAGLTKLTSLSLGGNPVADITPLANLTSLKALILSNCAAADYSPLAGLVNLEYLTLDHSTITDVSPLASLTGLKHLYLADSPVDDYSPLVNLYPNLEKPDFSMASTLKELGFTLDEGSKQANYSSEDASISINHTEWGAPSMDWVANCILMSMYLQGDYKLAVGYYPDLDAYVFNMVKDGETVMNYVYDAANDSFTFASGDRTSSEQVLRAALDDEDSEDVLLALIPIFNDTIKNEFSMTADALYALPFEPPTLKSLGFVPDEANAIYLYEQHEGNYINIEVHRPEWGEKEYDVRFFTPFNEYGLIVTYDIERQFFHVATGKFDDETSFACFDYYPSDSSRIDTEVSEGITVEEYLKNMYADPGIEDVYLYSVQIMQQYISDTFGMSIDELYALPAGE